MNSISSKISQLLSKKILNVNAVASMGIIRNCSFKNIYSQENLYPNSKSQLFTPTFVPDPNEKFSGYIPIEKLKITYSRSSGPGGQNVDKVNTKVDLRFNVKEATWISEEIKEKLLIKEQNRINKDGYLVVKSDLTRYQIMNVADALEKLRAMIRRTITPEKVVDPETEELKRKRKIKAARERIYEKRMRSQIKKDRNVTLD
ncbi:peptidyl-tRNA hydrolase ICT1, mitochondrial [Microplitis demolitor]|uniref:peptidyl-tRNA hydrolase ICT1, mitochondrial n=1 Tax=Microplitis demolitor TaxID=69319 RepID=UPI0004CD6C7E|nr:peptidyl-tRNA hydrolase ICT1, mitochondrial [Microplitis demolitor]